MWCLGWRVILITESKRSFRLLNQITVFLAHQCPANDLELLGQEDYSEDHEEAYYKERIAFLIKCRDHPLRSSFESWISSKLIVILMDLLVHPFRSSIESSTRIAILMDPLDHPLRSSLESWISST